MRRTTSPWSRAAAVAAGLFSLGLFCGAARAEDACKGLADAMIANAKTPYHSIGTITTIPLAQQKPGDAPVVPQSQSMETIFTGTAIFVHLPDGKWQDVHASLDDLRERVRQSAESFTDCKRLSDETKNGTTLAVYTGNSKGQERTVSTKVWVAPDRGVLVRSETDLGAAPGPDGGMVFQTIAIDYDYKNIQAPTDVK